MDALGKFGEHSISWSCSRLSPRATLTFLSCSPNFPRASITRYTHAKHEPILILYLSFPLFLAKREITLRSLLSEVIVFGRLRFRDLLTPVKFYRYFRRVVIFGGLLLSEFADTSEIFEPNIWEFADIIVVRR